MTTEPGKSLPATENDELLLKEKRDELREQWFKKKPPALPPVLHLLCRLTYVADKIEAERDSIRSALSASQARAEKAEATLRDALVVLAGCKVGTPAEGFIEAPIGELGWCIRKVRDERDSLRTELAPAKGRAERLIRAIDLAFFFRGCLPPLAREQAAPVTEPLVDAFQELGLVPGASLTDKGETK